MRLLTLQSDYDVAQAPPTRLAMGVLAELTSVIPHALRPAAVTGAIRTEVYDLSMIYGVSLGSAWAYCFSYCRRVGGADPLVCGRRPRRPAGVGLTTCPTLYWIISLSKIGRASCRERV